MFRQFPDATIVEVELAVTDNPFTDFTRRISLSDRHLFSVKTEQRESITTKRKKVHFLYIPANNANFVGPRERSARSRPFPCSRLFGGKAIPTALHCDALCCDKRDQK